MYQIYCIHNTSSDGVYIGQSKDFKSRFYRHKKALDAGKHDNLHLMRAWKKYGSQAFEFFLLATFDTREECSEAEVFFIAWYAQQGLSYNMQSGGHTDFMQAEETKQKVREAVAKQVRPPMSQETKDKIRAKKIERDALAAALKPPVEPLAKVPYQHSEETRAKIAARLKGNTNGAGERTDETKRKLSEVLQGKYSPKWSEERKQAQSENFTGRKRGTPSDEVKAKISATLKGRAVGPPSEEHRRKISEAQKRAYANGRKKGTGRPKKQKPAE